MKRDMNLVRNILLHVEQSDNTVLITGHEFVDINKATVCAHVKLIAAKGLIAGDWHSSGYKCTGLTWEGYELLDNIRDDSRWAVILKGIAKSKTFSMGVLQSVAASVASTAAIKALFP